MSEPAMQLEMTDYSIPRRLKISSKRQITIPVDVYERHGFTEYAMLTETPDGLVIQPVELVDDDEELTMMLLRHLIAQGFEGEELLERYAEAKPKFVSYYKAVERAEADVAAGRVGDAADLQNAMRSKYGL